MPYLNPAQNQITVSECGQIERIEIVNLVGQFIKYVTNTSGSEYLNIDISDINNGFYLLKMSFCDGTVGTKQFIKR